MTTKPSKNPKLPKTPLSEDIKEEPVPFLIYDPTTRSKHNIIN